MENFLFLYSVLSLTQHLWCQQYYICDHFPLIFLKVVFLAVNMTFASRVARSCKENKNVLTRSHQDREIPYIKLLSQWLLNQLHMTLLILRVWSFLNLFGAFIKRQTVIHRVTMSGTTSDNEWYNEWQQVVQRVVQRVTTNGNEWQRGAYHYAP